MSKILKSSETCLNFEVEQVIYLVCVWIDKIFSIIWNVNKT